LEFVGFEEELTDTERCDQDAECKTNGVVLIFVSEYYEGEGAKTDLVSNEEEAANHQNTPDCNVGYDFSCQGVGNDGDSSIPVQSHKSPCQRARNSGNVNQSREGTVAEVEEGEIEQVHN